MIDAPRAKKKKLAARALIASFAQGTPITAALAHFCGYAHPSQLEKDIEQWRNEITDKVNDQDSKIEKHEAALYPTASLTGLRAEIAEFLVKETPDGLIETAFGFDDLNERFPESEQSDIEAALYDLQHFGLVNVQTFVGDGGYVHPTLDLFVELDHQVMGFDTVEDARAMAKMMLDDEKFSHIPTLDNELGWGRRRLNPPVAYLMQFFPEGRTLSEHQPDYPTFGFAIDEEDRAVLRRFVAGIETP